MFDSRKSNDDFISFVLKEFGCVDFLNKKPAYPRFSSVVDSRFMEIRKILLIKINLSLKKIKQFWLKQKFNTIFFLMEFILIIFLTKKIINYK